MPLTCFGHFVAFLRVVHYEGYITEVFDSVQKCKIHLSVFILHKLGLYRPVSASSSFFKILPSHLHLFCLQFSIIFAMLLLFILFTCRSKLDLHLFSFSSTASAFSSYQIFFIPFVVKEGVPDCSAEKFHLHRCRSFVSFCLKVQISLPHRRQGRAGALYAFILQYF